MPKYQSNSGLIAQIKPAFCRQHAQNEYPMLIVGRALKLGSLLVLVTGIVLIVTAGINPIPASVAFGMMLLFAGIMGLFVTSFVSHYRGRPFYGVMSKEGYVWIDKVHPDFLDSLPVVGSD